MYPSVTLCPFDEDEAYNNAVFENCEIEKHDYVENGKWSSETCPDLQGLHENLVHKVEDFVVVVTILTYNQSGNQQELIFPNNTEFWKPLDSRQFGRCFSLNPPEKIRREGIFWLEIFTKIDLKIFFHNPGLWSTLASARSEYHDLLLNVTEVVNVEHQVLEMISSDKSPCRSSSEKDPAFYNYDECRFAASREEAMEKLGCTSLFCGMANKSEICTNQQEAIHGMYVLCKLHT